MNKIIVGASIIIAVLLFGIYIKIPSKVVYEQQSVFSGVSAGNEYFSTTTSPTTGNMDTTKQLTVKPGALGSVIITGASNGITIYDATTSDITKRQIGWATSSLPLLASIPNALTAGTYAFDTEVRFGILIVGSGTRTGTTTITYR